jgi:Tol biopolymer transport system component/DNA-binding winged helix-turn-helix (wHTH) protein
MASVESQLRTLRFSDFEVDLRAGELLKAGAKVKFGGQPFQILRILLEHPGELVTREELGKRLWPDTFVDVDHNLNTAVNKIREVLGDSAERPRFVETLPRRGYRFIGELEAPVQPVVPSAMVEPDGGRLSWRWIMLATGFLAILVASVGPLVAHRWGRQQSPIGQAALSALPFTALPRRATSPAFSPDGSRIAFAWNGDPKGGATGFDLYVKALGSETILRLTQHPSEWLIPAWSPDGTQIAFHRMDGADTGIYVVPALGGAERKLRSTRIRVSDRVGDFAGVSWSPDGNWIAFADLLPSEDHASVNLLSMETLESKQILINPSCIGEGLPAFSHNGEYLAYWCLRRAFDAVLYSLPIRGGQPKAISSFRAFPNGLTWSPHDEKLIYSLNSLGAGFSDELGEVTVKDGSIKKLEFARSALQPTVSSRADKLAYSSFSTGSSIWRRDLNHPESPAVELIPSSRGQFDAQYSPEGKRIAFVSLRTGLQGVWISNGDGSGLVQISNPNYVSGSPQWSPDGNKIAFDSHPAEHWEIYLADVAERKPRKLVTNITNVIRPHWSRDGKWIYFSSQESGRMGIYRCPVSGGDAVLLSKGAEEINARESLDGKTVYFASNHANSTLKQITLPVQPGGESNLEGLPLIRVAELWTLSHSGIYFVPADAPRSLRYFDFSNNQVHSVFQSDKDLFSGLSVSPDGRWIIYSQIGDENGDIMLVEHYR